MADADAHRRDAVADAEPGPTPDPRESRRALLRTTWSLAWPVIFSFSIESIVGVCDMLMVGRLGRDAVAGVGVGVQILGAANFALIAVGTGALAIVARHIGARQVAEAENAVQQSVLAAVVLTNADNYLAFAAALGAIATLIVAPVITVGLIIDVRHQKRSGGQLPPG